MASLVEVLAMLPVTPTTSGSKRDRQPVATAAERGDAVADPDDRDVAEGGRVDRRAGHEHGRGAAADGVGQVVVAVGAFPGQGHEQAVRADQPGVDGGAPDRARRAVEQPAAGQADQVVGASGRARSAPVPRPAPRSAIRRRSRRPVWHGHRSPVALAEGSGSADP